MRGLLLASFWILSGAAHTAGIEWQASYDATLARAKAEKKVVFIAVNMDRERANDRMVADHYKDAALAKLTTRTLNLFCSRFDHGSGDRACPRCGTVPCSAHMAVEKAVRGGILKPADGGDVVAPQHVFLDPDGKVILSVQYELTKGELEWCFHTALKRVDPTYAGAPSAGARAPRRLVMDGVVTGTVTEQAPTKEEVEKILDRAKRGERAHEMIDEINRLLKSDDPRAKEFIGSLLNSKGVNREGWLSILIHSIGQNSPQDWSELVVPFVVDSRIDVRSQAAVALEQLADPKTGAAIQKAFKQEKEDAVKRELLRALASTNRADKKTAATLAEQAAKSKDEKLRCAAVLGAALLDDAKSARAIIDPAIASDLPPLRAAGACAAAMRHDRDVEAALDSVALRETDPAAKATIEAALKVLRGADVMTIDESANALAGSAIARDRK